LWLTEVIYFHRIMTDSKATLEIHLQPGAKSNEIIGFRDGVLWVKVAAPPEKGRANGALIELMAKSLSVPKSDLTLVRGFTSRQKVIAIKGLTTEALKEKLTRGICLESSYHPLVRSFSASDCTHGGIGATEVFLSEW